MDLKLKVRPNKWISIVVLMGASTLGVAAQANDEQCLYNGKAFKDMLGQLLTEYPRSHYTPDKSAVAISFEDGAVKVTYGGCEHYSTEITFVAAHQQKYTVKEAFSKAVELVRQFGQHRVNSKALEKLLAQRKYEEIQPGLFGVSYPGMDEFTIEMGREGGHVTIVVSFYS